MSEVEIIKRPDESDNGGHYTKKNKSGQVIKKSAWMALFESLALVVLGLLLVIWPSQVVKVVAYVIGTFLVVKGGFRILSYFAAKGQKDFFNNDLLWGVISVIAGVVILVMGEGIFNAFQLVVGIWIIYEALVRMNTAFKMSGAGIQAWRYTMLVALIMLVLGIFVAVGLVTAFIGWIMILAGIIGIVGDVMFMQYVSALVEKLSK